MGKEDRIERSTEERLDSKFRQKDWVRKLEAATGKRIERHRHTKPRETAGDSLALAFRCSTTKRDFTIIFERESPKEIYKLVKTLADNSSASGKSTSAGTPQESGIDIHTIEYDKVKCPYCDGGDSHSVHFIKCGTCEKLSCAGGPREPDGGYLHNCPWCKAEGYPTGEIKRVAGAQADRPKKRLESQRREYLERGSSQRRGELPRLQARSKTD